MRKFIVIPYERYTAQNNESRQRASNTQETRALCVSLNNDQPKPKNKVSPTSNKHELPPKPPGTVRFKSPVITRPSRIKRTTTDPPKTTKDSRLRKPPTRIEWHRF
jgi:hypothetical protein